MRKLLLFIGCISSIVACKNSGPKKDVISHAEIKFDSCTIAKPFPMAQALDSATPAGFTGVLNNYWGDDTTKLDFQHYFEEGKLARSVFYFENGKIEEEFFYKCGALHGPHNIYYENGKLSESMPFRFGYLQGIGKAFDDKGNLNVEYTFVHDSLIGQPKMYYKPGEIHAPPPK